MFPTTIITTVNAPYSLQLDAVTLAEFLTHPEQGILEVPGHLSVFFGEVAPDLQMAFAQAFGISAAVLSNTAKTLANYSGEEYALAD